MCEAVLDFAQQVSHLLLDLATQVVVLEHALCDAFYLLFEDT